MIRERLADRTTQEIKAEINQLKANLALLHSELKAIEQSCHHQFKGNTYYETCIKCDKVHTLYY